MTTTGAAKEEDDEMEEAPLDLGPGEIIMILTEVTTDDLVKTGCERGDKRGETGRGTTSHQASEERLLRAVERDAAQPDAHRKEDEETLFAMSLVPNLKRLPQQRKAAVKVKIHQLLFEAEFNGWFIFSPQHR
ncbi:unnamed protein product [Coregonus sp. 'balchen']|nr:unnamed protein product [Coregonus sp. 'balchen']